MESKICTKCNTELPISNFYYRADSGKYRNECKECLIKADIDKAKSDEGLIKRI